MTIRELALNLIEHADETPSVINLARSAEIIGWLDPDTDLPTDLTPSAFMDAWNDIIRESRRKISTDNGHSFCTPEEALQEYSLDTIATYMDDDTRERVHYELAPCSDIEFLTRYLELSTEDLIIG